MVDRDESAEAIEVEQTNLCKRDDRYVLWRLDIINRHTAIRIARSAIRNLWNLSGELFNNPMKRDETRLERVRKKMGFNAHSNIRPISMLKI